MVLLLGSLQLGLIYGLLAMGLYLSFRILNIPDLTAEGSFTFGLAVSAVCTMNGHPILGIFLAIAAGLFAGYLTGLLQTKCGIHPILAGILTMSALYTVNLFVMGASSNLSLIGSNDVFKMVAEALGVDTNLSKSLVTFLFAFVSSWLMIIFFKTRLGLSVRATGDNEDMVRASSINVDVQKIIALAISNGLIGLSGGILAQYQGFADINSGAGILVVGLASVIIGEVICGKRGIAIGIISSIVGSILYRYVIAIATKTDLFPAYALKLVSAIIVAIALSLPEIKRQIELFKIKKEAAKIARNS